jgi:hypothetical protein
LAAREASDGLPRFFPEGSDAWRDGRTETRFTDRGLTPDEGGRPGVPVGVRRDASSSAFLAGRPLFADGVAGGLSSFSASALDGRPGFFFAGASPSSVFAGRPRFLGASAAAAFGRPRPFLAGASSSAEASSAGADFGGRPRLLGGASSEASTAASTCAAAFGGRPRRLTGASSPAEGCPLTAAGRPRVAADFGGRPRPLLTGASSSADTFLAAFGGRPRLLAGASSSSSLTAEAAGRPRFRLGTSSSSSAGAAASAAALGRRSRGWTVALVALAVTEPLGRPRFLGCGASSAAISRSSCSNCAEGDSRVSSSCSTLADLRPRPGFGATGSTSEVHVRWTIEEGQVTLVRHVFIRCQFGSAASLPWGIIGFWHVSEHVGQHLRAYHQEHWHHRSRRCSSFWPYQPREPQASRRWDLCAWEACLDC